MNFGNISLDDISREVKRRSCQVNQYTGIAPITIKVNGKYIVTIPLLADLFTVAGMTGGPDLTGEDEYILMEGGRGGGKSETVGHILKELSKKERCVILCTREVQNSIQDSVYKYIKEWIVKDNEEDLFHITEHKITNIDTGAEFIFKGMAQGTSKDAIKSIKGVKYVWCEEAQTLSHASIKMLLPTVREEGRKFFFTYNPKTVHDPINKIKKRSKARVIKINYYDNPFLPRNLWDEAEEDKRLDHDEYLHTWEGQALADDPMKIILPYAWLEKCVNAHKTIGYEPSGRLVAGVDVAEGETTKHDKNSIAIRQGPVVKSYKSWQCKNVYESVGIVKAEYYEWGFDQVHYDAIGVGVGISSEAARINAVEENKLPFDFIPFKGSSGVYGGDSVFIKHGTKITKNKDYFKNAKSQQWWNLRLMVQNTLKLLDGKKIDREDYFLSFEGDIEDWRDAFIEMSQATYKEDNSGRKQIDKIPGIRTSMGTDGKETKYKSPNIADAIGYAFVGGFENGLRAHAEEITKITPKKPLKKFSSRAY